METMTSKILLDALYYLFIYCTINQYCLNEHYICVVFLFVTCSLLVSFVMSACCDAHSFVLETNETTSRYKYVTLINTHNFCTTQCYTNDRTGLCACVCVCWQLAFPLLVAELVKDLKANDKKENFCYANIENRRVRAIY